MSDTVVEVDLPGLPKARLSKSDLGWVTIFGFVAAYDYWAIKTKRETLSSGCWRALRNPKTKWPVVLACTSLYKHLMFPGFLPKVDPLYWIAERWHRDD